MEKKILNIAIVQARMNSSRLRGKVLKKIGPLTCIELLLKRLSKSKLINKIIVATSTNPQDNILYNKLSEMGVECFRGEEQNVLKRFVDLLRNTNATNIIRITGDCPLIDPLLVDKIIKAFLERNVDYGSNVNPPTFPDGMDVEIFSRHCIEKINDISLSKYHLEHVTSYMREDENILKYNHKNDKDFSNIRITLDEEIDLGVLNSIVNYFAPNIYFTLEDIINLYKENKSLFKNVDLNRNEGA